MSARDHHCPVCDEDWLCAGCDTSFDEKLCSNCEVEQGDVECPGTGNCHGCLKFCTTCGDVAHICDARLRGEVCAEHPVPPAANVLKLAREEAERMIRDGRRMEREGREALSQVEDSEQARRAYVKQLAALEAEAFQFPQSDAVLSAEGRS
jgi:hypothetical protein